MVQWLINTELCTQIIYLLTFPMLVFHDKHDRKMYSFKTFLNVLQFIWEGSLADGSQRIPQSHTEQQSTHKRYIGREITQRVAFFAQVRNSREMSKRQDLYRVSQLGRGGTSQGEASQGGDWQDFKSRIQAFYSLGQELGLSIRTVIVFCGWNLTVGGPQGRGLVTFVP